MPQGHVGVVAGANGHEYDEQWTQGPRVVPDRGEDDDGSGTIRENTDDTGADDTQHDRAVQTAG